MLEDPYLLYLNITCKSYPYPRTLDKMTANDSN